jgi:hypothetical protein
MMKTVKKKTSYEKAKERMENETARAIAHVQNLKKRHTQIKNQKT